MPRYDPIPYDHLVIPQGSTFETSWHADDAETGTAAEWSEWSARLQIRTAPDGDVLATLATTGVRDGTIRLSDGGNVTATIPNSFTKNLSPGAAVFDLVFIDPDGAPWRSVEGSVYITAEVTDA